MKHKKRHLSGERVNHKRISTKFFALLFSEFALLSQIRLFFSLVMFTEIHENTKVISVVFDSQSLRLNKQIFFAALCGSDFWVGKLFWFFGKWIRISTLILEVCQKYVNGFMMIIVSEKWLTQFALYYAIVIIIAMAKSIESHARMDLHKTTLHNTRK